MRPGNLEIDSVIVYALGKQLRFVTKVGMVTKVAYTERVKNGNALNPVQALNSFESQYQVPIYSVQTDNGSEFFKSFHEYLEEQEIKHVFTYPNSPKLNGVIERFNRTVQEEFINRSKDFGVNQDDFQNKLTNYLIWYNNSRPHSSLGYQSPMQFIQARVQ